MKQKKQGWFYSRDYIYIFTNISESTAFLFQGLFVVVLADSIFISWL